MRKPLIVQHLDARAATARGMAACAGAWPDARGVTTASRIFRGLGLIRRWLGVFVRAFPAGLLGAGV